MRTEMRRVPVRTLAFVLAGGEGTRLRPLTATRSKPAVPFNGKYRIVDFVLSNLANSGIDEVHLLVQHQAQGLIDHVKERGSVAGIEQRVNILSPRFNEGSGGFLGTADAVAQNIRLIEDLRPDVVAIFSADHIYRMDVRQMIDEHLARKADVSIATVPVPLAECASFGIVETDESLRIRRFHEKPARADPMPGRNDYALASMGNYIFSTEVLLEELRHAANSGESDFGKQMLPRLVDTRCMLAYDFTTNRVPGLASFEEPGYWRDVGTIDAYFEAQLDTLGPTPRFRIANPLWPIRGGLSGSEPARIENSIMRGSIAGARCVIEVARLEDSMLRQDVKVGRDAWLHRSIIMDSSSIGRGARISRAIIDQGNFIPPGEWIGGDPERDARRFHVSQSGIVVVPQGHFPRYQT